mgnify:CR=1 FL=1
MEALIYLFSKSKCQKTFTVINYTATIYKVSFYTLYCFYTASLTNIHFNLEKGNRILWTGFKLI